jgi:cyanophycin synthetase
MGGVDTLEQLAEIKRIVIEAATDTVVLNADDKNCLMMADYADADNIFYVTMHHDHALVKQHIDAGGKACVLEKGMNGDLITIYDNLTHIPVIWSHLIPATIEGKALHNVQNAMFTVAMAYSFGQDLDQIRLGLKTFNTTFSQAPGRMNVFDEHSFRVILDYAHNQAAFADKLEGHERKLIVASCPGDRRDEDIVETCEVLAGHYDHYFLKADDNRRGRGDDEIPNMMKDILLKNGVSEDAISVISNEVDAIEAGLSEAKEKDLLIISGDNVTRSWKQIINFGEDKDEAEVVATEDVLMATPYEDLIEDSQQLIRDERGVRLARDYDEDGD